MLLLKHTLQQLLNVNAACEDGPGPSSGSAVPTSPAFLLCEPHEAKGNVTGIYVCPSPGGAVRKRKESWLKKYPGRPVGYGQPAVGTGGMLAESFTRKQRGDPHNVSWRLGVPLLRVTTGDLVGQGQR